MDILQQVQNQESANEQNVETNWYKNFTKIWANLCFIPGLCIFYPKWCYFFPILE